MAQRKSRSRKGPCAQHPAPPPDPGTLPHALTFFLTDQERRAVLDHLRRHDRRRTPALLRALGLSATSEKCAHE